MYLFYLQQWIQLQKAEWQSSDCRRGWYRYNSSKFNIKNTVKEILKVKNKKLLVGAAVGTSKEDIVEQNH